MSRSVCVVVTRAEIYGTNGPKLSKQGAVPSPEVRAALREVLEPANLKHVRICPTTGPA